MRLYLDHAASTPMFPEVIAEMQRAFVEYPGNASSIHLHGRQARAAIEDARKRMAQYLGVGVGELFFTSGGTEANNLALKSAIIDLNMEVVISSSIEHPCVLRSIEHLLEKHPFKHVVLPVDFQGRIDLKHLEEQLEAHSQQRCLVSIMQANNEVGTMNDLHRIGEICQRFDAILHSDTVQTIGHFALNLTELPVAMACGSAHKFHGPKGIGFLYLNQTYSIKPLIDGGGQERNMRAGTENIAGILGMAKALEQCYSRMDRMQLETTAIRNYAMQRLVDKFPGVQINGDPEGAALYTVLSVTFPSSPSSDLLVFNLDIEGISASGGSACSSGAQKVSHVLQAIMPQETGTTIRFSFAASNTYEEVDFLISKLAKILHK